MTVEPLLLELLRTEQSVPAIGAEAWRRLASAAAAHGLTGWLFRRLTPAWSALPPDVRQRLERRSIDLAARTMMLATELAGLVGALEAAGVRCAPLRGLDLAERVYGDAAARPMGDIDLLVSRGELARVSAVLGGLGFAEVDRRAGFASAFSNTLELVAARHGGVVVEPHWSLAYPPFVEALAAERVWAMCRRGTVAGTSCWRLGTAALLVHLCLHIAHKEPGAPLLWTWELDRLVRREAGELDWPQFVALTDALAPLVWPALARAVRLFDTPVPRGVREALERRVASGRQRRLLKLVAATSRVDGKESLAALLALPGFRARLRYASAVLFPSPRFMTLEYGLTRRRQLGAAYVRRASYFTWQGLKGVLRLCC